MAVYFLDSSALVKRYASEKGTGWVRALVASNEIYAAAIAIVEVLSAIERRRRAPGSGISPADAAAAATSFRAHVATNYGLIEIRRALIDSAATLAERHGLRAYDAVQLASALELQSLRIRHKMPAIIFVSADNVLNTAAQEEGLIVENPNNY